MDLHLLFGCQLPSSMDFFVMLSSIAGVFEMKGQVNYAASNTFQDALARYRVISSKFCLNSLARELWQSKVALATDNSQSVCSVEKTVRVPSLDCPRQKMSSEILNGKVERYIRFSLIDSLSLREIRLYLC